MTTSFLPALCRRRLLTTVAASSVAVIASQSNRLHAEAESPKVSRIRPAPAEVSMVGNDALHTRVLAYDGLVPGPVLRLRQGTMLRAVVENGLTEGTTVHWHGIRLPNAMDGVPGLTQPTIRPGGRFDYAFSPPDAGTFWYHSHDDSLVQMGRGLAGPLIVEELEPPAVDRDLLWTIQDWRLEPDAQIAPGFSNRMEAAMDGRVGNTVTINGRLPDNLRVRAGERVRLRLLNAAIARIMALRFVGHSPIVVALDGQPCDPHEPADGRILLGPAMRADVMLDMQGEPGRSYPVVDDFYDRLSYTLVRLSYDAAPLLRPHPSDAPLRLPPNPVPRPDLATAVVHDIRLQGGMMSGTGGGGMMGMSGGAPWGINGQSMTGDGSADMPPLFRIDRGRSCILDFRNETAWWHPMHLHGHSFSVLSRDGAPVPHDEWGDTVLVRPREHVRVAFVADNPGDWMLHCHVMEHQAGGLMTTIRVS
ncbi:MAG: multicopper oxidase family protein [Acidibrevibacterium sp.]|uniref:multicopper oxidase family protein n=1 Tax=Acidibrevibacterium fodinaquatile TaxID=1969806 RepID=UPI0023A837CD|nr:multicopper oxidase family protein [Acidibrevibacterium fodinaquatile]MCA7118245.1 multicopper oxidase family protein [Acidibrevibacterium fodinaquatile]